MTPSPLGVLLVNLGTPAIPTTRAVRDYLAEFLSDKRVIELPAYLWQFLLKLVILPVRAKRSAKLYQSIWMDEGSPLAVYSQNLAKKVQATLGDKVKLVLSMRYGTPTIQSGIHLLQAAGVQTIVVLGLYPQYSAATAGSCFDVVTKVLQRSRFIPHLHFISSYFDHPLYIRAWVNKIQRYWLEQGKKAYLLFSFHGLPEHCSQCGDPYEQQCYATVRLIAESLQLSSHDYKVVFQSRFGKSRWLQPYCDTVLKQLITEGIKNVVLICPGFAVDCLETLEEIAQRYRRLFLQAGGKSFDTIAALNDTVEHSQLIIDLIQQTMKASYSNYLLV